MSAPIYLYTGPEAGERKEAVEKITGKVPCTLQELEEAKIIKK